MQTVFLIMYLWHAAAEDMGRSVGGPVLKIQQMPSMKTCEVVGAAAKVLADSQMPSSDPVRGRAMVPVPAVYRCISVPHE